MRRITTFIKQTWSELQKVVWPTRRRTIRLTVTVLIVSLFFGAFIGLVDLGLTKALEQVVDNQGKSANTKSVPVPAGGNGQQPVQIPGGAVPNNPSQPQGQ